MPDDCSELRDCHALPCSIQADCKAATHVYFQPTRINEQVNAACFRGRGLLSKSTTSDSANVHLVRIQGKEVRSVAQCRLKEWHHEHDPEARILNKNRANLARDWIEVSRALHDPLPLPSSDS